MTALLATFGPIVSEHTFDLIAYGCGGSLVLTLAYAAWDAWRHRDY